MSHGQPWKLDGFLGFFILKNFEEIKFFFSFVEFVVLIVFFGRC